MNNVWQKAERARRELRSYRGQAPHETWSETMRWWHLKYTRLIIDYLCDEVPDDRLLRWREVFTALHELAGMGFRHFDEGDVVTEDQAWRRVDPEEHMFFCRLFSLNPRGVDPSDFTEDYLGFFALLADRGVIGDEVAGTLSGRYAQLLAMQAA